MFVSDKLVYLQMQKTASTHIAKTLAAVVGGEQHLQHKRLAIDPAGRLVVASIRNPWSWYVSLWAYGCRGGGGESGLYNQVTAGAPTLADVAKSAYRDARAKRREALAASEGEKGFDDLQKFLEAVHTLSSERRLSRFMYLAAKPA